jgi:hypothetical protein
MAADAKDCWKHQV